MKRLLFCIVFSFFHFTTIGQVVSLCNSSLKENQCTQLVLLRKTSLEEFRKLKVKNQGKEELTPLEKKMFEYLEMSAKDIDSVRQMIAKFSESEVVIISTLCEKIMEENFIAVNGTTTIPELKKIVPEVAQLVKGINFEKLPDSIKSRDEVDSFVYNSTSNSIFRDSIENFGKVIVGKNASISIPLSNFGPKTMEIQNVEVPDAFSLGLAQKSGFEIDPGKSKSIMVKFSPVEVGEYQDYLKVITSSPDSIYMISLVGVGKEKRNIFKLIGLLLFISILALVGYYWLRIKPEFRESKERLKNNYFNSNQEWNSKLRTIQEKAANERKELNLKINELEQANRKYQDNIQKLKNSATGVVSQQPIRKGDLVSKIHSGHKITEAAIDYITSFHHDIEEDAKSLKISKGTSKPTPRSLYELREKGSAMDLLLIESANITKVLIDYSESQLEPFFSIPHPPKIGIKLIKATKPAKFRKEGDYWVLTEKGEAIFYN